ncbi:hypothetical protein PoB_000120900 [Plakobranchus ocellatus]|uniref:Uncharacterized protein n=1 Tax=Plakobranchus ocellatus TaxID=259542 RepID=A0AAV3XXP9_9GAST|nr:hypothetical protein PoB_000120900 [Plakobranchus ocellatus]
MRTIEVAQCLEDRNPVVHQDVGETQAREIQEFGEMQVPESRADKNGEQWKIDLVRTGIRTSDLLLGSQPPYQMSYRSTRRVIAFAITDPVAGIILGNIPEVDDKLLYLPTNKDDDGQDREDVESDRRANKTTIQYKGSLIDSHGRLYADTSRENRTGVRINNRYGMAAEANLDHQIFEHITREVQASHRG